MTFDPSKPVKTRDGREAGIYWVGDEYIHGWINDPDGFRIVGVWNAFGRLVDANTDESDLVNVARTFEVWLNVYKDVYFSVHLSKSSADQCADDDRIACRRVVIEEGFDDDQN